MNQRTPIDIRQTLKDAVRREGRRSLLRALYLAERVVLGPLTPKIRTPRRLEYAWEHCQLYRYQSLRKPIHSVPVLLVPPLGVTPDIFDLRPGHSLVEFLLSGGFDVFLLDFGTPTKEDQTITVSDYVLDFIPNAAARVKEITGEDSLSMIGWSMGGIFIILYASVHGEQRDLQNAVIIGSPVDFSKMFPVGILARVARRPVVAVTDRLGNIPPFLSRTGFKILKPIGLVQRYLELLVNLWDREWVAGFETIDRWVDGFVPYPGETFKEFVSDFLARDLLKDGKIRLRGRTVQLDRMTAALLVISGSEDLVAPARSVEPLIDMVSSRDIQVLRVPRGHIGLVAGSRAPELVWAPMARWLASRS